MNRAEEYENIDNNDMTPKQRKLAYKLITNPRPGSDIAAAKEYGIDLTLLVENLALTPTERALKLCEGANSLELLRLAGSAHRAKNVKLEEVLRALYDAET